MGGGPTIPAGGNAGQILACKGGRPRSGLANMAVMPRLRRTAHAPSLLGISRRPGRSRDEQIYRQPIDTSAIVAAMG